MLGCPKTKDLLVKLAIYSILFSIQTKKGFQKVKGYRKERRKTILSPGNNRRSNKREKKRLEEGTMVVILQRKK